MELKFFSIFFVLCIVLELAIALPILKIIKKIRAKSYKEKDVVVTANKVSENLDTAQSTFVAVYEWMYNGEKRKLYVGDDNNSYSPLSKNHVFMYHSGSYPETLDITVDRKTGKYKQPEAERKIYKINVFIFLLSAAIAYYLTVLITGINPIIG